MASFGKFTPALWRFITNKSCLNFPVFKIGDDPQIWIRIAEQFFVHYDVPDQSKVSLASYYIDKVVLEWMNVDSLSDAEWEDFATTLYDEFHQERYGFDEVRFQEQLKIYDENLDKMKMEFRFCDGSMLEEEDSSRFKIEIRDTHEKEGERDFEHAIIEFQSPAKTIVSSHNTFQLHAPQISFEPPQIPPIVSTKPPRQLSLPTKPFTTSMRPEKINEIQDITHAHKLFDLMLNSSIIFSNELIQEVSPHNPYCHSFSMYLPPPRPPSQPLDSFPSHKKPPTSSPYWQELCVLFDQNFIHHHFYGYVSKGIRYKSVKKKKDMNRSFLNFESVEQMKSAVKEFLIGYALQGKLTMRFMMENFREVTAIGELVDCPNVSINTCELIEQSFSLASLSSGLLGATSMPSFTFKIYHKRETRFRYSHSLFPVLKIKAIVTSHWVARESHYSLGLVAYENTAEYLGQFNIEIYLDCCFTSYVCFIEEHFDDLPPTPLQLEEDLGLLGRAQVKGGLAIKLGSLSILEVAGKLLGTLHIYHLETLLMNICSKNSVAHHGSIITNLTFSFAGLINISADWNLQTHVKVFAKKLVVEFLFYVALVCTPGCSQRFGVIELGFYRLNAAMHDLVVIMVLVGAILEEVALGYWTVQKVVMSEDGHVNVSITPIVNGEIELIVMTFKFQSTPETILAMRTLISCLEICFLLKAMLLIQAQQSHSMIRTPGLRHGRFGQAPAMLSMCNYQQKLDLVAVVLFYGAFWFYQMTVLTFMVFLSISRYKVTIVALNGYENWLMFGWAKLGQLLGWEWPLKSYILKQQGNYLNYPIYSLNAKFLVSGADDNKVKEWAELLEFCFVTLTFTEHLRKPVCKSISSHVGEVLMTFLKANGFTILLIDDSLNAIVGFIKHVPFRIQWIIAWSMTKWELKNYFLLLLKVDD